MVNDILDIEVAQSRRFVVEIGCNDGTALGFIKREGIRHLGIDASRNVIEVAERNGINVINSFFSNTLAQELIQTFGTASHVFAANVICHIPDLHDLASGIKTLLQDDGVFVFEEPYLCDMLRKFSYDQIYDEHIYMFSLYSITNVFSKYGLFLFDAEPQETHGGSMRYFLSKGNSRKITNRLKQLIEQEEEFGVTNPENYDSFVSTCLKNREDLVSLLVSLKEAGKTVAGYAATSKSTTVLNFCGIGPDLIQVIYDSTPDKIGCVTPGSNIPIESQNVLWKEPPDYLVLFAWNHKMEIMMKERDRLPKGQKWILFVPRVEIFSE
jgi:methylation protein EvaC